jgi:hypothetical protein
VGAAGDGGLDVEHLSLRRGMKALPKNATGGNDTAGFL